MDVRPLGFEWRPRGSVAKVASITLSAFVGVCLAGTLGALVGAVMLQSLEAVNAGEEPMVPLWVIGAAMVGVNVVVGGALAMVFRREVGEAVEVAVSWMHVRAWSRFGR
jgi:hypothetical protein